MITFSNRRFPTKVIALWESLDDAGHAALVAHYFEAAGGWGPIVALDRSPRAGDPLLAVVAAPRAWSKIAAAMRLAPDLVLVDGRFESARAVEIADGRITGIVPFPPPGATPRSPTISCACRAARCCPAP